jgi:hypothetical protein
MGHSEKENGEDEYSNFHHLLYVGSKKVKLRDAENRMVAAVG